MGGRSTTTTVEEKESPEEEGDSCRCGMGCSSVLSAGWRLGKAVAIAGAAVASAPVVLPPLLVSAALGLAFSVPAGLLFACYRCNEKVMSHLLSSPSPAQEDQLGLLYTEEEEGKDMVGKKATKIKRYSVDEEAPQTEMGARDLAFHGVMDEGRLDDEGDTLEDYNGTEMGTRDLAFDNGMVEESMEDKLVGERERRNEVDGTNFVMRFQDADSSLQLQVELDESRLVRPEEVVTVEEISVVEREVVVEEYKIGRDQEHSVEGMAGEDAEVAVEHVVYASISTAVSSAAIEVLVGETGSREDNVELPISLLAPDAAFSEVKLGAKSSDEEGVCLQLQNELDKSTLVIPEEVVTVEEHSVVERQFVVDEYRVSLSEKSGNRQHSVNDTPGEDAEISVEHIYSSITTEVTSLNMSVQPSGDEGIYSEEEIWEQINALRLIIGYNADRQSSSMEELKALYIFTGMEPPTSFTDQYDLLDANNKLRFLKSVVGIK